MVVLGLILILVGIVGCIIPILPGAILAFVGLVCAYFGDASTISNSSLAIYAALTLLATLADYFLPAYMSRLFGGTKAGQRGATAGMIAGILVGNIIGAIIGPFIGAVVGELIYDNRNLGKALKVGCGSFLSFIVGTGIKLSLCIAMLVKVWADIWPIIKGWFA